MGTPIVYEEPSPLGAALSGLGAYGQEQQRRKEAGADLALRAAASKATIAADTRAESETERHDRVTEQQGLQEHQDATAERYYATNQSAFEHEQSIIEDHWKTLATLYERHIEYLGRMKIDTARIQQQYAAAQLRYSADMQRLATQAADTKANNETRIEATSMQIQGRLDAQYNQLQAGMSKAEYQAIQQAARATGSSIDPNTGYPTDYDSNFTPAGRGNEYIQYVVPPGYNNPQAGQVQPKAGGQPPGPAGGGAPSFKTAADALLKAVQSGQLDANGAMRQLSESKVFKSLPPAVQNQWVQGLARLLQMNSRGG